VTGNWRDYYYAKYRSTATIQNTDTFITKAYDDDSMITVLDTNNYIYDNSQDLPAQASPTNTLYLVTRAATNGASVKFNRVNLQVTPQTSPVNVLLTKWPTASVVRRWEIDQTTPGTQTLQYEVSGLTPNTQYKLKVNGQAVQTLTSDLSGNLSISYIISGPVQLEFELKQ